MTLEHALDLLPGMKDDVYFELRKQHVAGKPTEVQWVCAQTDARTNIELCNNIGPTPEIAVKKMLIRHGLISSEP